MREAGWRETGWDNPKPAPETLALVQDFVNTRNYFRGGDLLGDAEEATVRLAERGLLEGGERVGEAERRRLVAFREGLRGLLLAHNGVGEEDARDLNYIVSSAALRVRFGPDGRPDLEPVAEGGLVERIVGRLLAEVVQAEAEERWERLKACRNEGCLWAFYDASKNRSGSWCNMDICGARHKMRVYRERKSGSR
ncbi:MAG: CGNR zinc finger domain-containing protein [Rubrobacter sp.]|nr:CGNR zinc finger domain-containing protein [Rubrobacter sp.]